jgi:hypothetical protein
MSTTAIDFSKYETAAPAIDFSKYEKPETTEPSGFWDTLKREGKAAVDSITGIPASVHQAFTEPPTDEEKEKFGLSDKPDAAQMLALGTTRMSYHPLAVAGKWYGDAAQGKVPNAYEQALSVAPEAMGNAAGNVIGGKLIEAAPGAIRAIPGAARAVAEATPAVIRAGARGANLALAKAPGTVGAAAGGALGAASHLPLGTEIGAGIGGLVGKEILPKLRVPGEDFGLPPDATGENPPYAGESTPPPSGPPDATGGNKPYAGEPAPKGSPKVPAKTVKQSQALGPNADALQQAEALRQPVHDIVDREIPSEGPTRADNLQTKAEIEFHLDRGDVDSAEKVFQAATERAKQALQQAERRGVDPSLQGFYGGPERRFGQAPAPDELGFNWQGPEDLGNKVRPETEAKMGPIKRGNKADAPVIYSQTTPPGPVPSVQNIRENLAMAREAEASTPEAVQAGKAPERPFKRITADTREDNAIQQEMNWDLEKHGWRVASEARREFIARNSTGVTKGQLIEQAKPAAEENLAPEWSKTLDYLMKKQRGEIQ